MANLRLKDLKIRFFCVLILQIFLVACTSETELLEPSPLVSIKKPLSVKKSWSRDIGDKFELSHGKHSPLVLADRVVGVDGRTKVTALGLDKGNRLWSLEMGAAFGSGIEGDLSDLVLAGLDGQIYLMDTQTGSLKWQSKVSSEVLSVPAMSRNKVVVQSADGTVFCFDRMDGRLIWRYKASIPVLTLRGTASPKIWKERVLAGFSNGKLTALDLNSGERVWEAELGSPEGRTELDRLVDLDGEFLVKGDVVYAASYQGQVVAIELYSGRRLWAEKISSTSGLVEFAGQLFVTDDQGHIWALDSRTGNVLWSNTLLQGRRLSAPLVVGRFLVVSDLDGYVHWLSLDTGDTRARRSVGDAPVSLEQHWSSERLVTFSSDGKISLFELPR